MDTYDKISRWNLRESCCVDRTSVHPVADTVHRYLDVRPLIFSNLPSKIVHYGPRTRAPAVARRQDVVVDATPFSTQIALGVDLDLASHHDTHLLLFNQDTERQRESR